MTAPRGCKNTTSEAAIQRLYRIQVVETVFEIAVNAIVSAGFHS